MRGALGLLLLVLPCGAWAQWTLQESHTTASLRGIHAVSATVAWASGSGGTVLRTVDGGTHWQVCAVPDGDKDGAKLDFRGVQGFDASTAIVMSSGKGDLSRLYKTVDGCGTWKLLFTNPEPDGFWDAIRFSQEFGTPKSGVLLGDPVRGRLTLMKTEDQGESWHTDSTAPQVTAESCFAASNSSLVLWGSFPKWIATGGKVSSIYLASIKMLSDDVFVWQWTNQDSHLIAGSDSQGAFSIAAAVQWNMSGRGNGARNAEVHKGVAVGGDYKKADANIGTAAFTGDDGAHWIASAIPPAGYRSAVAYDKRSGCWITVGPNGTDVSSDDGRNWRALKPGVGDAVDADKNWNALSLPFVVGAKGRIGVLRPVSR